MSGATESDRPHSRLPREREARSIGEQLAARDRPSPCPPGPLALDDMALLRTRHVPAFHCHCRRRGVRRRPQQIQLRRQGVWLVKRVNPKFFYQFAYILIFLLALDLIFEGARGIWFT